MMYLIQIGKLPKEEDLEKFRNKEINNYLDSFGSFGSTSWDIFVRTLISSIT